MKTRYLRQALFFISLLSSNLFILNVQTNAHNADTWIDGVQAYQKVCGHCHDTGIGPDLKGRKLPPSFIKLMVRNGNRAMPAFGQSTFTDKTLDEVAQLISNSKATDNLMNIGSTTTK